MDELDALTGEDHGRWHVFTRNTHHLFNLDTSTYVRTPATADNVLPYDGRPMRLTRVDRWPAIGGKFFIWLDDPQAPATLEHWRQSSTIRSITRVLEADPPS